MLKQREGGKGSEREKERKRESAFHNTISSCLLACGTSNQHTLALGLGVMKEFFVLLLAGWFGLVREKERKSICIVQHCSWGYGRWRSCPLLEGERED